MIFHVQPVADLLPVTVDRQPFATQRVDDHQRDELFREVVRAVVVGAVGGENRKTIGVMVGAHQVIAGRLARRVRAVWLVLVRLGERRSVRRQGAIDFVGGNMQETERLLRIARQGFPVGAHRFEQAEGANDVGLDEVFRAMNRTIDMRLGGEIDHRTRLMLGQQLLDQRRVGDIAVDEQVLGVAIDGRQALQVARVGQLIQVDDQLICLSYPVQDKVSADEAGSAGY